MALSDCVDCWDTPCACGTGYQRWSKERLIEQIAMLQKVLEDKIKKEIPSLSTVEPSSVFIMRYVPPVPFVKSATRLCYGYMCDDIEGAELCLFQSEESLQRMVKLLGEKNVAVSNN